MSRSNALVTAALMAVLALGLSFISGPLGIVLAGAVGLAATFGFYWRSRDVAFADEGAPRSLSDQKFVTAQPDPDLDTDKHWGWRAASGLFAGFLIVFGFTLSAWLQ